MQKGNCQYNLNINFTHNSFIWCLFNFLKLPAGMFILVDHLLRKEEGKAHHRHNANQLKITEQLLIKSESIPIKVHRSSSPSLS